MKSISLRIFQSSKRALPKAGKTVLWLLKIILPVSFVVSLMQYFGVIAFMATYLSPVFSVIGLPGESAIVFISSIFLSLYAPIAIIATLALDLREVTILAIMCLISHNLIVESAVQQKTGTSAVKMFIMRILVSFVAAYILNLLLPENIGDSRIAEKSVIYENFNQMLIFWLIGAFKLIIKIVLIVTGLMILQNILNEFRILNFISGFFAPVMKFMGLSPGSSFLWFISQIVGLTYGSAIMIEAVEEQQIAREDVNLLNYHIAINHSLLEDTLLFVAIGVPAGWIVLPRFTLAIIIVWSVKLLNSKMK